MEKVTIIGAGIIGLSISNQLKNQNYDITLIDKNKPGMEASYASAGMLAAQSEFDFYEDFMEFCIKSREMYPDYCKDIEKDSGINVEFQKSGMIRPALNQDHEKHLKQNFDWQKRHGFDIDFLDGKDLRKLEPSLSNKILSGLHSKNDGQVNNRKLMEALIIANKKSNVQILENTNFLDYKIKDKKIVGIKTNNGEIDTNIVINAAGAWSSEISKKFNPNFNVKPIHGQMVALRADKKLLDKVIFASILGKGGYIVPRKDNSLILGSTMEDQGFNKKLTEEGVNSILKTCYEIIPEFKNLKIIEKWSGFRPVAEDKLPIIGKTNIENLFIATAHFRNGILLAPITAKAMEELIVNDKVIPDIKHFGLDRFKKII